MKLQLDVAKEEFDAAQARYETIRIIAITALVLGLSWPHSSFRIPQGVTVPLREAEKVASNIAAGDLSSQIIDTSQEETRQACWNR